MRLGADRRWRRGGFPDTNPSPTNQKWRSSSTGTSSMATPASRSRRPCWPTASAPFGATQSRGGRAASTAASVTVTNACPPSTVRRASVPVWCHCAPAWSCRPIRPALKELIVAIERDVAIVGAGPAGLTAAAYLAARGLRVIVVDEYYRAGGRLLGQRYENPRKPPPHRLWNGEQIACDLEARARRAGAEVIVGTSVWDVAPQRAYAIR